MIIRHFLCFSVILLAILLPALATAHDFEVDGIYYNINGNEATVTFKGSDFDNYSNEYSGSVVIPATVTHNGTTYPVTAIDESAFFKCTGLAKIVIPNSVTEIGSGAFSGCSGLTSINIPNSVTAIRGSVFERCSRLTSIVIPNSVTSIGDYAFYKCEGLTSVNIPNSVTAIGEGAFNSCTGLTSIVIPNSVTSIGFGAFLGCSGLTSIYISNSVTEIGNFAFVYCSGLTSIVVESGNPRYDSRNNCNAIIETANNTLIVGCKNTIIPNSVTDIGILAFALVTELTSINIPNSVTVIDHYAFANCTGLTDVYCYIADLSRVSAILYDSFYLDNGNYSGRTLHVLQGMADAYRADENWYPYFGQIVDDLMPPLPGDVNGDLEINIADVNAVIDIILGGNDDTTAADVNGDGEINIADINAIIDIILSGTWN